MASWLVEEEQPFEASLLGRYASRSPRAKATYSLLIRGLRVLSNRRLWGASDVVVYSVVVDGYPDMKSGMPFWAQQMKFAGVRDGASLAIDPEMGELLYRGRPRDFVNVHLLVARDTRTSAEFAKVLRESFLAEGIGTVAGAAVSIFSGLPGTVTVSATRNLVKKAVNTTLDYFVQRKELIIGTYYGSLIKENNYGLGVHPPGFPASFVPCGDALELAYEVRK